MNTGYAVQHVQRLLGGETRASLRLLGDWESAAHAARTRLIYSAGSSVRAWPALSAARTFDQGRPLDAQDFEVTDCDAEPQAVRVTPLTLGGAYLVSVAATLPGPGGAYLAAPTVHASAGAAAAAAHATLLACAALDAALMPRDEPALHARTLGALLRRVAPRTGTVTPSTAPSERRARTYVVTVSPIRIPELHKIS